MFAVLPFPGTGFRLGNSIPLPTGLPSNWSTPAENMVPGRILARTTCITPIFMGLSVQLYLSINSDAEHCFP
jgi:hypothetical protein